MKFKINQKVIEISTGKKAIIIANKKLPYKPTMDAMNRKEIYPESDLDYLIMFENKEEDLNEQFKGTLSVPESNLKEL